MVQNEWSRLGNVSVARKLKMLKALLRDWNKGTSGNFETAIKKFEMELEVLDRKCEDSDFDEVEIARKVALQSQLEK